MSRYPDDPAVAPIEQILARKALPHGEITKSATRRKAVHALWICACVCWDMAPTWLIYDEPDGTLRWCRLPNRIEARALVDAQWLTGNHCDPELVLSWLQGEPQTWWNDDFDAEDELVLNELGRKLRDSQDLSSI